ncbi:unnamed protein product [Microthlaspi erraticum]|uniref:Uncharacterized protein n=1 Tax=Microthlaspi erraticum TaxID=1685480 RepID=A0A6D2JM92_9BRAS|nr:unnamed protein product [Microthlaspi erraticum]
MDHLPLDDRVTILLGHLPVREKKKEDRFRSCKRGRDSNGARGMGKIDDLTEEFHGEVADLRNQVKEHHTELTGRMDSMDNKFSELNANMSRISETLAQLVAQR